MPVGPERAQHGYSTSACCPKKPTWDDTAALITDLDLVIRLTAAARQSH
jgi:hypothetical protein